MQSRQALQIARDEGLDLVVVSPTAQPPVCKIIDYGKFKYLEGKLGKDKKSKQQELKGIKISPRIADHDLAFLVRNAIRFLEEGNKVKVTCQFKAREVTHPELGRQKLDKFMDEVKDYALTERTPILDGKFMIMILLPKPNIAKPSAGAKKNAKDQDQQNSGKAVQDHRNGKNHAPKVAQQPPVPAQERKPEAPAGAGADAV